MTVTDETFNRADIRPDWLMDRHQAAFARDLARLAKQKHGFVVVPCPACGSAKSQRAFVSMEFPFVTCLSCETLYMSPRPSPAAIAEYYATSENVKFWAEHIYPTTTQRRRDGILAPRLRRLQNYYEHNNARRDLIVEVGLGFGSFSQMALDARLFDKAMTLGPGPELAGACNSMFERSIQDKDGIPMADAVVSFDLLERVFQPEALLTAISRILSPGGLLALSCTNALGFDILTLGATSPAIDGEHLNLFNPNSLTTLLGRCGFEVAEIETPGNLDVDIVRDAALKGELDLTGQRLLKQILIDDWERCGRPFQDFLSQNRLSSHMWCVARRIAA